MSPSIRVGTAGWNVPKEHAAGFPVEGSHLERYAQVFNAVEINSSDPGTQLRLFDDAMRAAALSTAAISEGSHGG